MCRSGVNSEVQVEVSSGVNASAASAIMIMCLRLRHGVTLGGGAELGIHTYTKFHGRGGAEEC